MSTLNNISFYEKPPVIYSENKEHWIFVGQEDGKDYKYLILPDGYINDGREAVGEYTWFPVVWYGNAGSIYEVTRKEGKTVSYTKKNFPIGIWKNSAQRNEWQAAQRACEDRNKMINQSKEDSLMDLLAPIRKAYANTRRYQEKAVLLGRVIIYITSGRL